MTHTFSFSRKRKSVPKEKGFLPAPRAMRKGQSEMLEHLLLILFIVVLLVFLLLGLAGWQASQARMEQSRQHSQRALALAQLLFSSPYSQDGSFSDSLLTALSSDPAFCTQLTDRFGPAFAEFNLLDANDVRTLCTAQSYPQCNTWQICAPPEALAPSGAGAGAAKGVIAYLLPITISRDTAVIDRAAVYPQNALATLKVGVLT